MAQYHQDNPADDPIDGPKEARNLEDIAVHEVKTWPEYFQATWDGKKPFDVRRDDRPYRLQDVLAQREWCPDSMRYTGRMILAEITYRTDFEQRPGVVVLGIRITQRYGKHEAKR